MSTILTQAGSVSGGMAGTGDYYDITINSESIVTLTSVPTFTPGVSKGDADLNLYQVIDGGEPELKYQSSGNTGETDVINAVLEPGNYRVEILPFIGTVNYTLTVTQARQLSADFSDFGIDKSYSVGMVDWGSVVDSSSLPDHLLVGDTGTVIDFLGHKGDLDDAYSFTVDKPTTITATLTPDTHSNVDLALYDDLGTQIKGSFESSGVPDTVTANLKAGTYWVDASFVSSNNQDSDTGSFTANYDLSINASQYVLPTTSFRAFNGSATALAETFNFNNSGQYETIHVTNATYGGMIDQSAVVNNFAGEVNAGILLTTGSARDLLGHTYNQKQGLSTADSEIVNNWSNKGGNTPSMEPLSGQGNAAGYNQDVFNAVSSLVNEQNKVLDAAHQLEPIRGVYDSASLSFDVSVEGHGNNLTFDLMFASEEFSLFADKYVDSAVIIVDGVNYALFNKADPKTILSVTQSNVDSGYFYPNTQLGDGTSVYPTEFNGVSRLISVVAPMDPTKSIHHVTIAIADTNDHVLDSGIFMTNLESLDLTRPVVSIPLPAYTGREGLYAANSGTTGNDELLGTEGRDLSILGVGDDQVDSGGGNDIVQGGLGNDSVDGGAGNDALDGGVGNDSMDAGSGNDEVQGGTGTDTIFGGDGADIIQSGTATDRGNDSVNGGAGNDIIQGGGANDVITGGVGADTVDGGAGRDVITGGTDAIADSLNGGAGNDTITAGAGNDTVSGGTGADTVNTGAGNDSVVGGTDNIGDKITVGAGNDSVTGGGGNDTITVGTGADVVDAGAGNDRINAGTDAIGDSLTGGAGNDIIAGGAGSDTISAGTGADAINAGAGNDVVVGGTDSTGDTLNGGAGNDTIDGSQGSDMLTGGTGADIFAFDTTPITTNTDHITDFVPVDDMIQLEGGIFDAFTTTGAVDTGNFVTGSAAADGNDYLIYNSATGALLYDADGVGGNDPVQVAILGIGLNLTSSDFTVI